MKLKSVMMSVMFAGSISLLVASCSSTEGSGGYFASLANTIKTALAVKSVKESEPKADAMIGKYAKFLTSNEHKLVDTAKSDVKTALSKVSVKSFSHYIKARKSYILILPLYDKLLPHISKVDQAKIIQFHGKMAVIDASVKRALSEAEKSKHLREYMVYIKSVLSVIS